MKKTLIGLAILIILFLAFLVYKGAEFYTSIYKSKNTSQKKELEQKTSFNILLLGYGGGRHEGATLTDSMILANLNLKTKSISLISIPRDIWVKLPTKSKADFYTKINAVYQLDAFPAYLDNYPDIDSEFVKKYNYGSLTNFAVQQVTGLPVDNLVAIDFDSFKKGIDLIGGVDVNVKKAFEDPEYPLDGKENELCGKDEQFKIIEKFITPPYDEKEKEAALKDKPELVELLKNATEEPELAFPCRYEKISFKAGLTHMDGATALKYVRSRHGIEDGGDFGRAARQQQFIQAVKDKVISINFIPRIIPLIDQMKEDISIDITPDQMKKFIAEAPKANQYQLKSLILSTENLLADAYSNGGQYILISKEGIGKWDSVKNGIKEFILGITPTPVVTK